MLRKILSWLTQPRTMHFDTDIYWIFEINHLYNDDGELDRYHYREVKQNSLGMWCKQDMYVTRINTVPMITINK